MKNIPKKIYLQVVDNIPDEVKWKELRLEAITWSLYRQNNSDICYVLEFKKKELIEENERFKKGLQTIASLGKTDDIGERFLCGIAEQTLKTNKK